MVKRKETKVQPQQNEEPVMDDPIRTRVQHAVSAIVDRKAFDVEVLDVRELTTLGDYFILCSGNSERQTGAISDAVQTAVREKDGVKPLLVEGETPGRWILVDYGDFIVHIFTDECRKFYSLERLWGDAPRRTNEFVEAPPSADERKHA